MRSRCSRSDVRLPISKRYEICALTAADHVCGAHEARVVRTNDVAKMERIVRIWNGQPDEAFLPVSPPMKSRPGHDACCAPTGLHRRPRCRPS
jgi:hypothetical protein